MKPRINTRLLIFSLLLASCFIAIQSAGSDEGVLEIRAHYVAKAPDGLDDSLWQETFLVRVPVQGRDVFSEVKEWVATQVVYTATDIYFRFSWQDRTHSILKNSWRFDGEHWVHMKGNEDRLALLFEITRIDKFASRGCAVVCHSPPDLSREKWRLATRKPIEKGDLWHWKAARSDPYGHADDEWLTFAGNPTGSYRETGRRKDTGNGGDIKNQTADGSNPRYQQNPAIIPSVAGFLLFEEAIEIPNQTVFKTGDILPYRLPVKPSGSRFDVKAESKYDNNHWHLMLHRRMDTGNEDDVAFNPLKRYSFAMAVFDNSGADHSKATRALVLTFQR